jgi:group I intron endonuclease
MNDIEKIYIYILIDPRDNQIRYVGKTNNPIGRMRSHMNYCYKETNHKSYWLRQLADMEIEPILYVIEETTIAEWEEREKFWIRYYKNEGCNLTNLSWGGQGNLGIEVSDETRNKMSEAARKKPPISEKTRVRMSQAQLGRKHSEETKKKIGKGRRGAILSEELKARISQSEKGKYIPLRDRIKMSEAKKLDNSERYKKIAIKLKGRKRTEKEKANMRRGWAKRKDHLEFISNSKISVQQYAERLQNNLDKLPLAASKVNEMEGVVIWGGGRILDALVNAGLDVSKVDMIIDNYLPVEQVHGRYRFESSKLTPINWKPDVILICSREYANEIKAEAKELCPTADIIVWSELL